MNNSDIHIVWDKITLRIEDFSETVVGKIAKTTRSPFRVLISTIISSRTKDEVTRQASENLFEQANTPEEMLKLSKEEIQELIYPAGFYKQKSGYLLDTCQTLLDEYDGDVPDTIDELVELKGVGRKTANLVVTLAFDKPGICVDTHVHRITNRWGYIDTEKPRETEFALREKLPEEYWIPINNVLVTYGQNICTPISPRCSECPITEICEQVDVEQSR